MTKVIDADVSLPEPYKGGSAYYKVQVEYNAYGRDMDKVVLVLYAKDGNNQWHIVAGDANAQGNIIDYDLINGNSIDRIKEGKPPLTLTASCTFPKTENDPAKEIEETAVVIYSLKSNENTVPLIPTGDFGIPGS